MVVVGIIAFAIGLLGLLLLMGEYFRDSENDALAFTGICCLVGGALIFFVLERIANYRVRRQFTNLHLTKEMRKKNHTND